MAIKEYADCTVVEFSSGFCVATLVGKLLADLNCGVVKIEEPDGDPLRRGDEGYAPADLSLFELISGSKDSLCCDLEHPDGAALLTRVLGKADVLVLDRPGMLRLQNALRTEDLHASFPQSTICVCTPFGIDGPLAHWQASEEIVQALSGIASTTGHPGDPPTRIAAATVTHTAAMHAVTSILGDLMAKQLRGRGALLDCCMFDAAVSLLTASLPSYFLEKQPPRGIGNRHTMAAPWNSFRCADGWAILCAGNDPTWNRLCSVIGRSDLLANPAYATQESRVRNVDALEAEITAWTSTRSVAEVETIMDRQGIPCGSILSLEQVLAHPQFADRKLLRECGERQISGGVFQRNREPLAVRAGSSELGAGWRALGRRLGLPAALVERWRADRLLIDTTEGVNVTAA